jgi:hypothetical protein
MTMAESKDDWQGVAGGLRTNHMTRYPNGDYDVVDYHKDVRAPTVWDEAAYAMAGIDALRADLAAVTAERDRLRAEVEQAMRTAGQARILLGNTGPPLHRVDECLR